MVLGNQTLSVQPFPVVESVAPAREVAWAFAAPVPVAPALAQVVQKTAEFPQLQKNRGAIGEIPAVPMGVQARPGPAQDAGHRDIQLEP